MFSLRLLVRDQNFVSIYKLPFRKFLNLGRKFYKKTPENFTEKVFELLNILTQKYAVSSQNKIIIFNQKSLFIFNYTDTIKR